MIHNVRKAKRHRRSRTENVASCLTFTCGDEEVLRMTEDANGTGSDHVAQDIDDSECSADDSKTKSRG